MFESGRDNANVSQYRVYVDNFPLDFRAAEEDTQTFTVYDLTSGSAYVIQVTAVNSLGEEGEKSSPIAVITAEKSYRISSSVLVGSLIGSVLAGALVAFLVTYIVMKRRNVNEEQTTDTRRSEQTESVEMKDSRLYAVARRGGPPKPEPSYEDAEQSHGHQENVKNPVPHTPGGAT